MLPKYLYIFKVRNPDYLPELLALNLTGCNVAGTSFIAFHFTAMTKTNKFNDGDFQQVCTSL